jgi:signal transduction histidine kinase
MPMPFPQLVRSPDDRVVAGVCGGIAAALHVDANLIRLIFALLALAGGAGIMLYLALWAWSSSRRKWLAAVLFVLAGIALLHGIGLRGPAVVAVAMIALGLTLIWRVGGSFRPGTPVPIVGVGLVVAGAAVLLTGGGTAVAFGSPGALGAALILLVSPLLWRLALERDAERTARIRTEERADVAARVHDSVLQTLALIQRHAEEPRRVASLARRQERELRSWLYGVGTTAPDGTLSSALGAAASEVEELHGVRVELANGSDCEFTEELRPLVLAAREAMVNAAKFSGADEVDVYAEADATRATVFVRDRGVGFDRSAVPDDRRGIAESIEGRMVRAGGSATVTSSPDAGTEIELLLPRSGS